MAPPAESARDLLPSLLKAALLGAALFAAGWELRPFGQAWLQGVRPDGPGALILVAAIAGLTAIGVPRQILAFTAGSIFGAGLGFLWAMAGTLLGALIDVLLARGVAGNWARRRLPGRMRELEAFVLAQPFAAVLTLRLLPVGNNTAMNLLAGVAGVPVAPFLAGSALGYAPQTVIFALLGGGVRLGRPVQVAVAAALFVASAVLGLIMWRHRPRGSVSAL